MRGLHVTRIARRRWSMLPVLLVLGLTAAPLSAQEDDALAGAKAALEKRDYLAAARESALAAERSDDAEVAERAARYAFDTGFDGYALRAGRRWVELDPKSRLGNALMGRLNLRRHDLDAAARSFSTALASDEPRRDEMYLALAADLAAEDDARLVTRVLARLTGNDPLAPGLQLALGNAALRSADYDLAAAAAATANLLDPDWDEPQLLAARAQAGAGDVAGGLARLTTMQGDEGERALLTLERVRILEDQGRLDEARDIVDELALRLGERPPVLRARAFLDMRAERLDEAARAFETLSKGDGDRFEAFYYLGQIARDQGDAERGRQTLARVSSGPYLVPARLAIAESLARENRIDEALASLRQFAADSPPQAFEILGATAEILASAGRLDEALAAYDSALAFKPESPALLLARGTLLDRMGRVDAALKDMARASAIAVDDPVVQNAYGYTLAYRTGRSAEAYARIRLALEQAPGSAAIQDSMGWVLFRMGRNEEARHWLETAFGAMPDPEIAAHLAEVWTRTGEGQRARDLLMAALVAYPASEPVRQAADRLLR